MAHFYNQPSQLIGKIGESNQQFFLWPLTFRTPKVHLSMEVHLVQKKMFHLFRKILFSTEVFWHWVNVKDMKYENVYIEKNCMIFIRSMEFKTGLLGACTANEYSHTTSIVRLKRCNLRLSTALIPTQILAVLHYNW